MKDEQKVYIRGVKGRGDEVIKMLKALGGKLYGQIDGETPDFIYCIFHDGYIYSVSYNYELAKVIMENYRELHLSEKWKDGDVLVDVKNKDCFAVCKSVCESDYKLGDVAYHCYVYADFGVDEIDEKGCNILHSAYRLATPKEVKRFQEMLHKQGKEWDAEKKQLVDWKWDPKVNENFYIINKDGRPECFTWYGNKDQLSIRLFGNYFRTREEAEAMAEKIKNLLRGGTYENNS